MKTVLTIAGSDCSGGAGIQADIKTITAHKLYAMSAITALTAQNTTGVFGIMEVPADFLEKQLDSIFSDIYPDAIKIGMVSSKGLIETIAAKLINENAKKIVLDPVMISTSGSKLLADEAVTALVEKLIPVADIITPNIPEAEVLSGIHITKAEHMVYAAEKIAQKYSGAILIKGGHQLNDANDLLYHKGKYQWFYGERIDNDNTHGTGCTLSSAIASNMAMGYNMAECVSNGKKYISGALKANLNLGKGSGPLDHTFGINSKV
ncbi:bifunctional hydroxymethylpyrimidine kinase/phosphomethylpyrimidine kinase [Ruminiclostridium herbifermentans]|uniref:Hydroxymethylpyrimidine/phosphomethylpyrimidine kinase n=1 Tax=Ruminiclostridium herbifermentans TaxID=2488810 RepID=A0A4U7JGH7_9FIRM|nr:bifunctional hydroxymethylpyrimidine kinase/phosphomethylpyrimidine kinase [Ruminiclostridium herbifermentans]QNU67077.1 bifunctional hydroxymethylpyrimidine kinase/phosphomethylpyrimidine kinase [Ruminiclostridium herbifermentans]